MVFSQTLNRVKVSGRILTVSSDKEGVTVFNTSANKGTITNEKGEFEIAVKLNDIIELSAIQFQKFSVQIDEKVLDSRRITVFLVEEINKLDEVVILPYDLSGYIEKDVGSINTTNINLDALYFGLFNIGFYDLGEDYKSGVKNTVLTTGVDNVIGSDLIQVVKLLNLSLFSSKKDDSSALNDYPDITKENLKDFYSEDYIATSFNIPKTKVKDFVSYLSSKGFDFSLYKEGKELEFLQLIAKERDAYLKESRE
jgi:hypothetical protein